MLDNNPIQVMYMGGSGLMTVSSADSVLNEQFMLEIYEPTTGNRWQGPGEFTELGDGGVVVANIPLADLSPMGGIHGPIVPDSLTYPLEATASIDGPNGPESLTFEVNQNAPDNYGNYSYNVNPVMDPSMMDPSMMDPSMMYPTYHDPSMMDPSMMDGSYSGGSYYDGSMMDPSMMDGSYSGGSYYDGSMMDGSYNDGSMMDGSMMEGSHPTIPVFYLDETLVGGMVNDNGDPLLGGNYAVDFSYDEFGVLTGAMLKSVTLLGDEYHPTVGFMDAFLSAEQAAPIEDALGAGNDGSYVALGVLAPPSEEEWEEHDDYHDHHDPSMMDPSMMDGSYNDGSYYDGSMMDGSYNDGSMMDGSMMEGSHPTIPVFYLDETLVGGMVNDNGDPLLGGNYAVDFSYDEFGVLTGGMLKSVTLVEGEYHPTVGFMDAFLSAEQAAPIESFLGGEGAPLGVLAPPSEEEWEEHDDYHDHHDPSMMDPSMMDGSYNDGSYYDGSMMDGSYNDGSMMDGSMMEGSHPTIPVFYLDETLVGGMVNDNGDPLLGGNYAVDFSYDEFGVLTGGMLKSVTLLGDEYHPTVGFMDAFLSAEQAAPIEDALGAGNDGSYVALGVLAPPSEEEWEEHDDYHDHHDPSMMDPSMMEPPFHDPSMTDVSYVDGSMMDGSYNDGSMMGPPIDGSMMDGPPIDGSDSEVDSGDDEFRINKIDPDQSVLLTTPTFSMANVEFIVNQDISGDIRFGVVLDNSGSYMANGSYSDGSYYDGSMMDGSYSGGSYYDGSMMDGSYNDGSYYDGSMMDGSYNDGSYYDGSMMDGSYSGGSYYDGSMMDGSYNDGSYYDGSMMDGSYNDGSYYDGSMMDGSYSDSTTGDPSMMDSHADQSLYEIYEIVRENVTLSAGESLSFLWEELTLDNGDENEAITLQSMPDLDFMVMAGVHVTEDNGNEYTMLYAASEYDGADSFSGTPTIEEALVGTEQDDDNLHRFNYDNEELRDNHVFVTNEGNDYLSFWSGGYQVAFMGEGNDNLYIDTTYNHNPPSFYYADMGDEANLEEQQFGSPQYSGGDVVEIDIPYVDNGANVGQIVPVSESTFVVIDGNDVEALRISSDSGAIMVEKFADGFFTDPDSHYEILWEPVGEFIDVEEMHIGQLGGFPNLADSNAVNWSMLSFADDGSVEVVSPIDAFEYYTFVEDQDELEIGELRYSSWIGNQIGLADLFASGEAVHGILVNAGSSDETVGMMTIEPGTIMFPSHNVVTIDSYGATQNGRGEIELTGTFGDDTFIAGSGDRVEYEMNWSPGIDTFTGGLDQYGRPNSYINFRSWHDLEEGFAQAQDIVFDQSTGLEIDGSSGIINLETYWGLTTAENMRRVGGTEGDDTIIMGAGNDSIGSNGGNDTLTGGEGSDYFYDLGFDNTVTITDYEPLETIKWEIPWDLRHNTIDNADLFGFFEKVGNTISFTDTEEYEGSVILGGDSGDGYADYDIAMVATRYNDWEVEVALNNGDVTDGYFHLNDDYTKVVFRDGHGFSRGSIDDQFGVTNANWQDTVTVEYDGSTDITSISIDNGQDTWTDIVEIEGEWLIQPDAHGDIALLDVGNIQSILDGAIEIRNDYNWIDFNYDTVPVQQLFDADRGFVLNDTDAVITVDGVDVDPYTVVNPNDTVSSYDGTSVDRIHFFSSPGDDYVVSGTDNHDNMFYWSPGDDELITPMDPQSGYRGDGDLSFRTYSNFLSDNGIDAENHGITINMDGDGTVLFEPSADLNVGDHSLSFTNVTDIWGTRGDDIIIGDEFRNFLNPGEGGNNILTGGTENDFFYIHGDAWLNNGSGLSVTITDYENYEGIAFGDKFGLVEEKLSTHFEAAYDTVSDSTSISIIDAGEAAWEHSVPTDGDYSNILTLEGGEFEIAAVTLSNNGHTEIRLENDGQPVSHWTNYWIGDDTKSAFITDYENNDHRILLDSDFGFSENFESEVTWEYDSDRGQTIISINTDSHSSGETVFIPGEVELFIANDPSDGYHLRIEKVRYSLDPEHERLGWNKVDDVDTPWDESFFPRYSDEHSPVNTPVDLGGVNDPFRTIFKSEIENNSHYAKDEETGVWLNEWMAARQTISDSEGYFVGDLNSSLTALNGTEGRDYYIIHGGDDIVVSTDGSDEFDIGFDAGVDPDGNPLYSTGIVYNAIYDADDQVIQDHEDYADDLDVISFQVMPEGVRVDVNAGAAYHTYQGSGGETYTTEFAGIEAYELSDYDDIFTGGGGLDINWIDPAAGNDIIMGDSDVYTVLDYIRWEPEGIVVWNRGDLQDGIPFETLHEYTLGGDNPNTTDVNEGHAHSNEWLPIDPEIVDSDGLITIEDAAKFDGVVLDSSGFVDRYTNVDYFIGSQMPDIFLGGDDDETFNPLRAESGADYVDGGDGVDTIIIEDARWGRGVWEPIADEVRNEGWFDINFDSVIISRSELPGNPDDHFKIIGEDQDELTNWYNINTTLNNVERIDLREYDDLDPATGSQDTEVYVIDSYEYLTYGQGDLGNMFYVTSLHHGEHDIHEVEVVSGEVLDNQSLGTVEIFYHGHHTDFDRTADVANWVASTVSATAAAAAEYGHLEWQGHESMFFAWYDPDGKDGEHLAYEIAVKYKDGEWRIENKVFDTFQDIALSTLSPEDLAALNAKSGAIDAGKHAAFDDTMSLRIKMAAAYEDITNIITSGDGDVDNWNFDQAKSTARSTFYVDIPNGVGADGEWDGTMQQVKVDRVADGVDDDGNVKYTWALDLDAQVLIKLPDVGNTLPTSDIIAGGDAAENVTAGKGSDTMLGGGGADTYTIQAGDAAIDGPADAFGIVGDVINEIGGDLSSDAGDSVALAGLTGIDSVAFERTAIRFEDDEATLRMTTTNVDGSQDVVHIFDHYNEDLPFRQVEQLLLDEGWEDDQIWNLVAGTSDGNGDILTGGAYRDVLVGGSGDDVLTSGGGIDVMQGGAGSDTFVLAESEYDGDIAGAHGNVTMIRDYVAGEDDIDLSLLGITAEDVTVEASGGNSYLVNTSGDTPVVLAELMGATLDDEDVNLTGLTG